MSCLRAGGAGAAAGVRKHPEVIREKPGALAAASAECGSDKRPGETA